MKRLFIAVFSMFLFMSHFAFADSATADDNAGAAKTRHHDARPHSTVDKHTHLKHARHSKGDNTQPVDINHADASAFSTLKGVGTKKAAVIVAYRQAHGPFQSVNDLTKVKGIGAKSLVRLQKNNPGRLVIIKS